MLNKLSFFTNKKLWAALGTAAILASAAIPALAATEGAVTATVTPGTISVTVSPGSVAYGTVGIPSVDLVPTSDTIINANNNGQIPETFNIKGSNATGATITWNITTGAPSGAGGTPAYGFNHKFLACAADATCGAPAAANTMDTNYETLNTNVAASASRYLKLRLSTPTETGGDTSVHSTSVTVQAVAF